MSENKEGETEYIKLKVVGQVSKRFKLISDRHSGFSTFGSEF